jgi:hypothetical protein
VTELGKCDVCDAPAVVREVDLGRTEWACFLVQAVRRYCELHERPSLCQSLRPR